MYVGVIPYDDYLNQVFVEKGSGSGMKTRDRLKQNKSMVGYEEGNGHIIGGPPFNYIVLAGIRRKQSTHVRAVDARTHPPIVLFL